MNEHKVLIAVPALDTMPVQTAYCMLSLKRDCPSKYSFIVRASCQDARNMLAAEAVNTGADRVLWIDSDMAFEPDLLQRLSADIDAGWDVVSSICFKRQLPLVPVIYKTLDRGTSQAEPYRDYPQDTIFPIAACGFGAVMTTTDVIRRIGNNPFDLVGHLSEDLSFCVKATEVGARIACDSRVKVGHVGLITYDEDMYRHPGG